MILEECFERVFSTDMGVEQVPLGLYIIRGDNMCVPGRPPPPLLLPLLHRPHIPQTG